MLNAKAMTKAFQSSMCPGVENIFLVNKTGALVLSANNHEAVKTLGAIASNIWSDYDSCMSNTDFAEGLREMILEGEHGVLLIETISSMYLCVQGGNDIGRLMEVLKKIKEGIEGPLQEIVSS